MTLYVKEIFQKKFGSTKKSVGNFLGSKYFVRTEVLVEKIFFVKKKAGKEVFGQHNFSVRRKKFVEKYFKLSKNLFVSKNLFMSKKAVLVQSRCGLMLV